MTASPAPGDRSLLEIEALAAGYARNGHSLLALRGVSLALEQGELLGLIGPNGSGKTTLLRAVTGIVPPVEGRIRLMDRDVASSSQRDIARLAAVVPQDPVLPAGFTVLECVMMGRTPHLRLLQNEGPVDVEAARRAMAETDTLGLAGRPADELSGGERQRVVLARALAQDTPLLLLDEPTAHLDIGHQASVLKLMRGLCHKEGKAVLAVVHDLTLAAQYCDRLVLLAGGTLIAHGTPQQVLTRELLEGVYGARVDVLSHPVTGRPVVAAGAEGADVV